MTRLSSSLLALSLVACGEKKPPQAPTGAPGSEVVTFTGDAMGSKVRIDIRCPATTPRTDCEQAAGAAFAEIDQTRAAGFGVLERVIPPLTFSSTAGCW